MRAIYVAIAILLVILCSVDAGKRGRARGRPGRGGPRRRGRKPKPFRKGKKRGRTPNRIGRNRDSKSSETEEEETPIAKAPEVVLPTVPEGSVRVDDGATCLVQCKFTMNLTIEESQRYMISHMISSLLL